MLAILKIIVIFNMNRLELMKLRCFVQKWKKNIKLGAKNGLLGGFLGCNYYIWNQHHRTSHKWIFNLRPRFESPYLGQGPLYNQLIWKD